MKSNQKKKRQQQKQKQQENAIDILKNEEIAEGQLNKQESLDMYMELKYEEGQKESEETVESSAYPKIFKYESKISDLKLPHLICIDDESIPSVNLQPSPKSHKPIGFEMVSYRTTTFMKMETQIFSVKITNPNTKQTYQIQRRFSDFVDLYQQIFYNHPGYVMYPFPEKTLDSFVKVKMGIVSEQGLKYEIIEKRMSQLQGFLNWVAKHNELCNSQEIANFILKEQKKYEEGRTRLNKYVEQYKTLEQNSKFNNIIEMGKSVFSYFQLNTQSPTYSNHSINLQYGTPRNQIISSWITLQKQKLNRNIQQLKLLYQAESYFSQFSGLETDIDILINTQTKQVSGKNANKKLSIYLETEALQNYRKLLREIQQAQKSLIHLFEIISAIMQSKKDLNHQKKAKLQRRLERTQKNFEHDWGQFQIRYLKQINHLQQTFLNELNQFKAQMKKIWKSK